MKVSISSHQKYELDRFRPEFSSESCPVCRKFHKRALPTAVLFRQVFAHFPMRGGVRSGAYGISYCALLRSDQMRSVNCWQHGPAAPWPAFSSDHLRRPPQPCSLLNDFESFFED
ncbi:hypothetical protein HNY73_005039 [Argiope bruennichi]|uniref:Uncharacterized protein n=1 Tax=Argiope bruennichi TaxID=94029 RepID=A0A8T0FHU1_ARGBR|nr:hypothetical protein HNY73_005039 [Argiope bruennichi]